MTHTAKPVRIADWNRMGTGMLLRKFSWSPVRLLLEQRRVQVSAGALFAVGDALQTSCCYQHQRGFPVGERADHAGPVPYLPVEALDRIVRADAPPKLSGAEQ